MRGESHRLHLRFSMQRPEQRRAYEILSGIPAGRRMGYICALVNQEARLCDLEQRIINAVKTALSSCTSQMNPLKEENKEEEIRGDIMDFLHSL